MTAEVAGSFAVETLGNLLIEKVVFLKDLKGDVEWVRDELKRMQCFLKDAAKKQSDSESLRDWISEIREVAHDIEDAIEKAIGSLTGLRYIKMRYTGFTRKLPRSWAKLTNLHVLDLWDSKYSGYIMIDKVILKMESLCHIYAHIESLSKVHLSNMKKLRTLRLLYLKESSVWQIQGMAGVTTLGFDMREMSDASKLFTHLATLENLVSLTLNECRIKDVDALDALHHITTLKLENSFSLEAVTNFPPKLSYLTLSQQPFLKDPMPVLERLPELLYLKMVDVHFGGEIVIMRHGFPKLKVLHFELMPYRNIQVEKGGMPELKQLFIKNCNSLNIEN